MCKCKKGVKIMVDFGKLTIKKAEIAELVGNKQDKKAGAAKNDLSALNSIFNQKQTDGTKNSTANIAMVLAGGEDAFKALSEDEVKQYLTTAALMDTDGNGEISEEEFNGIKGKSGVANTQQVDDTDIQKLYDELNVTDDAQMEALLNEVTSILSNDVFAQQTEQTAERKGISTEATGVQFDKETGKYSVTIEPFRSGQVQDDGVGGKRYPNGSFWGITTNAYPELQEADKPKVYEYIKEMNSSLGDTLYAGQTLELPILEYDAEGRVTGYKAAEEVKEEEKVQEEKAETTDKTETAETTAQPKMVGNRGYEAEYEIQNEDGTTTRFTVAAGQEPKIENAKGGVTTDGVTENGQFQRTVDNNGVKTVYTYAGGEMDGKPVTVTTIQPDGTSVTETRTYEEVVNETEEKTVAQQTEPKQTEAKDGEYEGWAKNLSTELNSAISSGVYTDLEEAFDFVLSDNTLSETQKADLFMNLMNEAAQKGSIQGNEAVENLMAVFNNPVGSDKTQVKLSAEQNADAVELLLNNNNGKSDSWVQLRIAPAIDELIDSGNIEKAVELGKMLDEKYQLSYYDYIDSNKLADILTDKALADYKEFATSQYGELFADMRYQNRGFSEEKEGEINKKLLDAAVADYPDELENVASYDKYTYEKTLDNYSSDADKLEFLMSSDCNWDSATKNYYMKQIAGRMEAKDLRAGGYGYRAMNSKVNQEG